MWKIKYLLKVFSAASSRTERSRSKEKGDEVNMEQMNKQF